MALRREVRGEHRLLENSLEGWIESNKTETCTRCYDKDRSIPRIEPRKSAQLRPCFLSSGSAYNFYQYVEDLFATQLLVDRTNKLLPVKSAILHCREVLQQVSMLHRGRIERILGL